MKVLKSIILLIVVQVSIFAADRRIDQTALKVMTFNAEFLWDGIAPEEGRADFPWKGEPEEAAAHMRKVAEVIIRNDPDVINLVEVENIDALNKLNDTYLSGRGYKAHLINGKDSQTGQDVAMLTRIDLDSPIQRDDRQGRSGEVAKSVSKNYIAKMTVNGKKLAFVGVHLLAIPNNADRKLDRQAQAEAIRGVAMDLQTAGYLPIVLGDMNDYDYSEDARDHNESRPISNVLQTLRKMGPSAEDDLKSVASAIPREDRFTAFWDQNNNNRVDAPKELTSIDHILVAPEFFQYLEYATIDHTPDPRYVSDHFPVIAFFRTSGTNIAPTPGPVAVRFESILPNPAGDDALNEEIVLKNFGTQTVSLAGWKIRDITGAEWKLLDEIAPQMVKVIKRNGQPMSLNNNGDTVDLVDPQGPVVQTVTYSATTEGEVVTPANSVQPR